MRKLLNRKNTGFALFMSALVFAGAVIPSKLMVLTSPSLEYRVFFLGKVTDTLSIQKGDYVVFEIRSKHINSNKPVRVIKKVGCVEGETIKVVHKSFYCNNNQYLGTAKLSTEKGEELDHMNQEGPVRKNHFFAYGTHINSFDSKYFGLIKKERIVAKAYPLF